VLTQGPVKDFSTNFCLFPAYVTRSDKKGLIARKYMCSLNIMYLNCSVSYCNSVNFNKTSMNFCISGEGFK